MIGSVAPDGAALPGPARPARLRRYALYQLRDFALERLAGVVIVLGLLGYVSYFGLMQAGGARIVAAGGHPARDVAMRIIVGLLVQSWLLLALVSVNGLLSTDRTTGRFRFLFAKPVVPGRFYLQALVVNGLALLASVAAAAGIIMALTAFDGERLARTLLVVAAGYLCVGGICFMMSALWRLDWLATGGLIALAMLLRARFHHRVLEIVLPPTDIVGQHLGRVAASATLPAGELLHVALYGLACIAIGLVVLHRRPLAR